jgi:hypothetical protein
MHVLHQTQLYNILLLFYNGYKFRPQGPLSGQYLQKEL